jgi:hypothetical protein
VELTALSEGVRLLDEALRNRGIPHAFGGAIAYGLYGIPRGTNDWDINVFCSEDHAAEVFAALAPLGVESNQHSYDEVQKKGQVRLSWGDKRVDLFFAYSAFHSAVEKRIREADFEGTRIWVLSAEDIVIFKVIFNRPHDWRDIERVCHRMGATLDFGYIDQWLTEILGADDSRIVRLRQTAAAASDVVAD